jgi:hypothetical protein
MAHRHGSPGLGERIVAKGLAGRTRNRGRFRRLATHATRSVDLKSVDVSSPLEQEDSYSPMTEASGYQTRTRCSNQTVLVPAAQRSRSRVHLRSSRITVSSSARAFAQRRGRNPRLHRGRHAPERMIEKQVVRGALIHGHVLLPDCTSHIAAGQVKVGVYSQRGAGDLRSGSSLKSRATVSETGLTIRGRRVES